MSTTPSAYQLPSSLQYFSSRMGEIIPLTIAAGIADMLDTGMLSGAGQLSKALRGGVREFLYETSRETYNIIMGPAAAKPSPTGAVPLSR